MALASARPAEHRVGTAAFPGNCCPAWMALIRARQHHCDEVLWLDHRANGLMTSTMGADLFLELGGSFATPRSGGAPQNAATRARVTAILGALRKPARAIDVSLADLLRAGHRFALGECFLAGSRSGIHSVSAIQVGGLVLRTRPGVTAARVATALAAWTQGVQAP